MHIFIKDFTEGNDVVSDYLIEEIAQKKKKNGGDYLNLTLMDKTGNVSGRMWENFENLTDIKKGDFVKVSGKVDSFNGSKQLILSQMKKLPEGEYQLSDFLKTTDKDVNELFEYIVGTIDSMKNEHLKRLMQLMFIEDPLISEEYKKAPAGKVMHNAYLGGLIEHVVDMLKLADYVCKQYQGIDEDILKAGVLIHDIGKIKELNYGITIDYSDEGKLVGHHVLGVIMLEEKIKQIPGFPDRDRVVLEHLILSHHGKPEWGSPKTPAVLEAVILHYIDNLDAKITGFKQFVENNPPEDNWTRRAFMFDNTGLFTG